jgi:mannosyltransferase OCH1-like enzyme
VKELREQGANKEQRQSRNVHLHANTVQYTSTYTHTHTHTQTYTHTQTHTHTYQSVSLERINTWVTLSSHLICLITYTYTNTLTNDKGRIHPSRGHEGRSGSRSIAVLFFDLGTRWGWLSTPCFGRFTTGEETRYPM